MPIPDGRFPTRPEWQRMNLDRLPIRRDEDDEDEPTTCSSCDRPWKPGWYPDPSMATVVRWWDGGKWTKHTAPNDARAPFRDRPSNVGRVAVMTIVVILGLTGLVATAYLVVMFWALASWGNNK